MFEEFTETKRSAKRWIFIPLSLLVHGMVIAAVVVFPLMSEGTGDHLPPVKVLDVRMVGTPPPPPPPPPAAPSKRKRRNADKAKEEVTNLQRPRQAGRLIELIDIPEDIPDDDDFGLDLGFDGVDGGVIGGVPGGSPGGVIGSALLGGGNTPPEIRLAQIKAPKLLKKVSPDYPTVAIKAHIQGVVVLEAVTDVFGRVARVRIITGHPLLQSAASYAVKQWIYEPYIINGIAKPVIFTVTVNFTLQR